MRIDIEQFLALTVAIGSVGAVGAGLYTNGTFDPVETTQATEDSLPQDTQVPPSDERPATKVAERAPTPPVVQAPDPPPQPEPRVQEDFGRYDGPPPVAEGAWM